MKKTLKRSMKKSSGEKPVREQWGEYQQLGTWRMIPFNGKSLIILATKLSEWSKLDTSLRINDFYNEEGIAAKVFYQMIDRCNELKEAHAEAMERIASRREKGALTRKYDAMSVYKSQAYYDSIYRLEQERAAKLKLEAEANAKNQRVTVELNVVEKTDEVKPIGE